MIRRIELETFCYESEDPEKVKQAMRNLAHAEISCEKATSNLGTKITRMRMVLEDEEEIDSFMDRLVQLNIDPVPRLEGTTVHLRLSKQAAYQGEVKLGSRDVVKVEISIEAYPARKAVGIARRIFSKEERT